MKITDDNGYIFFDKEKLAGIKVTDYYIEVHLAGGSMLFLSYCFETDKEFTENLKCIESIISKRDK